MFIYHLKLSLRALKKSKLFTLINLVGLTIGISCTLFILSWVNFELGFDSYNKNYDSIHILINKPRNRFYTPATFKPYLENKIPEISLISRIYKRKEVAINVNNNPTLIKDFLLADPEIFDIFTYNFLMGNSKDPLPNSNSIILTESIAKKLFGDKNPIQQIIKRH